MGGLFTRDKVLKGDSDISLSLSYLYLGVKQTDTFPIVLYHLTTDPKATVLPHDGLKDSQTGSSNKVFPVTR